MIDKYKAFIFDLDGTIYRGSTIIPGAKETIKYLKKIGKKVVFISNKTTGTVSEYYEFLKSNGLEIKTSEIINSTVVLKKYFCKNLPKVNFFAIGENSFIEEMKEEGFNFTTNPGKIEVLIITLDRTLNYEKLEIASKALENGARFFAANIDNTCPVEVGEIWDAGTTITALEKRTNRKLEKHFGKPSGFMMDAIKEYLQTPLDKCLIIGDRVETDIEMGNIFGVDSALVSTGVKEIRNGNDAPKPTYKIDSVYDIIRNV